MKNEKKLSQKELSTLSNYLNNNIYPEDFKLASDTLAISVSDVDLFVNDEIETICEASVKDGKNQYDCTIVLIDEDEDDEYCAVDDSCECDDVFECKHIAAVALHLIKINNLTVVFNSKKESKNSFGFVELVVKNNISLGQAIAALYSRIGYSNHNNIETELIATNELKFFSFNKYGHYNNEKSIVNFRVDDDRKLHFKCNNCNKYSSSEFCSHITDVISFQSVKTRVLDLVKEDLKIDVLLGNISKRENIETRLVQDYFNIYIDGSQARYEPKDTNLILSINQNSPLSKFSNTFPPNDDEALLDDITKLTQKEVGFLWTKSGDLLLVEGSKQKKGKKGLTGVKFREDSTYAPANVMAFYYEYKSMLGSSRQNFNFVKFLSDNWHYIKELNHYFIQSNLSSYQTFRKMDLIDFDFGLDPIELVMSIKKDEVFTNIDFDLQGENNLSILPSEANLFSYYFVIHGGIAFPFKNNYIYDFLDKMPDQDSIKTLNNRPQLIADILKKFKDIARIENGNYKQIFHESLTKQLHVRELGKFIIFEPTFIIDDKLRISIFDHHEIVNHASETIDVIDEEILNEYRNWMAGLHLNWKDNHFPLKNYFLPVEELVKDFWFLHFFDKAKNFEVEIFGQEKLSKFKYNLNKASVRSTISSGIDWFDASVEMKFGDIVVEQKDWYETIKNNEKFIKLSDGSIGILPEEWFNKLKKLVSVAEKNGDILKINKLRFYVIDQLFSEIDDAELIAELEQKKAALASYNQDKKYKLPKGLKAVLRSYQTEGFQWLKFCNEYGFGGCLADDMGLGKTVQVVALLLDQKKLKKNVSLVVVPKSLLFNWAAELDKFAPDLNYHLYHGPSRNKNTSIFKKYDVVISTYDTISIDVEEVKKYRFNYIILDESQAIKNISSQRYKAMRVLQSDHKLVMTGTPVENNTFDLYAQFSFLNPGLLGSVKNFTDNFSTPIDQLGSAEAAATLRGIIHPFLLRRTKENVAKDLPSKSESIIYCEMGTEQRKMYDSLRKKIKDDVEQKIVADGMNNSKFMILEGLLRLRQICNSPELVDSTLPDKKKESVKIQTLVAQLKEELGNHKALIFSQFVTMLDLIKKELTKNGIKFAYLDGSTNDRAGAVNDFMDDDDCHVFLLSLKAGNAGLNLTKADYVYIVDPWWNPAVETQAIDRTHRIGQTKNIFAYKLICKDTIEEKIVELQAKKKKLTAELIQADENIFKSLDKDELMSLFS